MPYEILKYHEEIPTIDSDYTVIKTVDTETQANMELEILRKKAEESGEQVTYGWLCKEKNKRQCMSCRKGQRSKKIQII